MVSGSTHETLVVVAMEMSRRTGIAVWTIRVCIIIVKVIIASKSRRTLRVIEVLDKEVVSLAYALELSCGGCISWILVRVCFQSQLRYTEISPRRITCSVNTAPTCTKL
jgi:hypothetical protein